MDLLDRIFEIASQNPDGFTVYIPSLEHASRGWVIANSATQNCFGREGLMKVLDFAMKHNRIVGGWMEDDQFYFDAPIIEPDEQKAIAMMVLHNQIAIYELHTGRLIYNESMKGS